MAEILVNYLVEKLLQIVTEQVNLIAGAKKDLEDLLEELKSLKAFLDDDAKQESNSNAWKEFVRKIRVIVLKTEDVIDKFLVQAQLHQQRNIVVRAFDLPHSKKVSNLASQIKDILQKIKDIRTNNQPVLLPKPLFDGRNRASPHSPADEDTLLEETDVVCFDEQAEYVMGQLIEESPNLKFVPIVGIAGLGKTTLARKICSASLISNRFSKKIWVDVGQLCELKDIRLKTVKTFTEYIEEFRYKDVKELRRVLYDMETKENRCLIVLDDVWATEVLDFFKNVLRENKKGHRIMMTTRFRDVASHASERPYEVQLLTPEESFNLLEKKSVFGLTGSRRTDEFVELAKSIARKCGGLPRALVVIARAMNKNSTKDDWKEIEKNVWEHLVIENEPKSCWGIVETSYTSLSKEEKMCFLYCLAFPKGYDIPAERLIRLWIAEELIRPNPRVPEEETAEKYLREFVKRGLMTVSTEISGSVKKLRCNSVFYEFYKMEATRQNIFQELRLTPDQVLPTIQDPDISRRLHIESSTMSEFISGKPNAEHVRSFLCFPSDETKIKLSASDIQLIRKAFPLIKVLKIEPLEIPSSSKYLNQLYHLRYISISGDIKELPAFFGQFWNLQSIIIDTSTSKPTLKIKANIWKMSRLKQLQTNVPAKFLLPSARKGKASCSLTTLSKVAPESCNKDVLEKAWNLKKLSVHGTIEAFLEPNKDGFSTFEKLKCLEILKLTSNVPCTIAPTLPPALFRFLGKLKKLTLSNTMFDWKEAHRLGQLECLEVLKLRKGAFTGNTWNTEKNGFRKLQVLLIQNDDLKYWEASRLHFPRLKKLFLTCPKLETVPAELSQFLQSS